MIKVLLTGYSGFIGSHLLENLLGKFDIHLLGREKPELDCCFFEAPIDSITDYSPALKDVDVVIHVAARSHIMNDNSIKPLEIFRDVNVRGTLNLANQASSSGVKRFIYISSIKVNGEKTVSGTFFTNLDDRCPKDAYAISKSEAEEELITLGEKSDLDIVIIRPPLVYGMGVKANFASLFKLVGKRFPLLLRSITNNKRSLVSVYNLVDLIKVCIEHPKATNQVFLVSDDNDISTSDMVAIMAKVQGVNNYSIPFPVWCFNFLGRLLNKQDVVDRLVGSLQVDITHTKETLDWQPPYSVEEGFAKCVEKNKGKK